MSGDLNVTGNLYSGSFNPTSITGTAGTITRITNTDIVGTGATFNSIIHVGSALTANASGDVETVGIITAASFSGGAVSGTTGTFSAAVSGTTGTFSGAVNVDATTDSTSVTTGALIVDGGLGVAKNVYIGAGLSVAGTLTYEDVTSVDSVGMVTAKSGVNVSGGELNVGLAYSVGNAGVVTAQNVTISAGTIDLKNSGSVSNIKFYCESANAHYTALQSAAHSAYGGNVTLTLPATTDTLIGKTTTDTLTNKTLTSPTLTTPVFSGAATGELKVGSGVTIAATSGVATFADGGASSNALKFGSGGDLIIYHDGTNSFIDNTGELRIRGTYVKIRGANDEDGLIFTQNGSIQLKYDNSTKIETTNDGTVTTGIATATGLDVADKITHTGDPNTAIRFPSTDQITFETNGSERLRVAAGTAGTCLLLAGDRVDSTNKTLHLTLNHYSFNTVNQIDVIGATTGSGYNRVHIGGADNSYGNTAATEIKFYTGANATTTNGSERLSINSGGDVNFSGTAAGVASAFWDASANSLKFKDDSKAVFGDGSDLSIYHNGTDNHIVSTNGQIDIKVASTEDAITAAPNGAVSLYHNNAIRLQTGSDGVTLQSNTAEAVFNIRSTAQDGAPTLRFLSDDFDDNADAWRIRSDGGGTAFGISNYADGAWEKNIECNESGNVELYYDNSKKIETTNDGAVITGITTFSNGGVDFNGILREKHNQVDAKLSADANINLENGMLHYYSINETTTATPNIRYSSSKSLNNSMTIGETVTVTIIYKPNGAGYYAELTIDSSGETEKWNGGDAPSAANSGGFDVLTHHITKTGNAAWMILSNVQNYA